MNEWVASGRLAMSLAPDESPHQCAAAAGDDEEGQREPERLDRRVLGLHPTPGARLQRPEDDRTEAGGGQYRSHVVESGCWAGAVGVGDGRGSRPAPSVRRTASRRGPPCRRCTGRHPPMPTAPGGVGSHTTDVAGRWPPGWRDHPRTAVGARCATGRSIGDLTQLEDRLTHRGQRRPGCQPPTVDLEQQRSDARRHIDQANGQMVPHPSVEGRDPKAQLQIKGHGAELHEQKPISSLAIGDLGCLTGHTVTGQHRVVTRCSRRQSGVP